MQISDLKSLSVDQLALISAHAVSQLFDAGKVSKSITALNQIDPMALSNLKDLISQS